MIGLVSAGESERERERERGLRNLGDLLSLRRWGLYGFWVFGGLVSLEFRI